MVTTVAMHIITKHSTADILTQEVNSANKSRFYGVMVSTLDFESSDPSSSLGRTFCFFHLVVEKYSIEVTKWAIERLLVDRSETLRFKSYICGIICCKIIALIFL